MWRHKKQRLVSKIDPRNVLCFLNYFDLFHRRHPSAQNTKESRAVQGRGSNNGTKHQIAQKAKNDVSLDAQATFPLKGVTIGNKADDRPTFIFKDLFCVRPEYS